MQHKTKCNNNKTLNEATFNNLQQHGKKFDNMH